MAGLEATGTPFVAMSCPVGITQLGQPLNDGCEIIQESLNCFGRPVRVGNIVRGKLRVPSAFPCKAPSVPNPYQMVFPNQ